MDLIEIEDDDLVELSTDDRAMAAVSYGTLRAAHSDTDDAYFHPGGRIVSIADPNATLDGWRPEPTIVFRRVRARTRRSWIVLGLVTLVAPLLLLVAVVVIMSPSTSTTAPRNRAAHTLDVTKSPLASTDARARGGRTAIPISIPIPIRNVQSLSSAPVRRVPARR